MAINPSAPPSCGVMEPQHDGANVPLQTASLASKVRPSLVIVTPPTSCATIARSRAGSEKGETQASAFDKASITAIKSPDSAPRHHGSLPTAAVSEPGSSTDSSTLHTKESSPSSEQDGRLSRSSDSFMLEKMSNVIQMLSLKLEAYQNLGDDDDDDHHPDSSPKCCGGSVEPLLAERAEQTGLIAQQPYLKRPRSFFKIKRYSPEITTSAYSAVGNRLGHLLRKVIHRVKRPSSQATPSGQSDMQSVSDSTIIETSLCKTLEGDRRRNPEESSSNKSLSSEKAELPLSHKGYLGDIDFGNFNVSFASFLTSKYV